MESSKSSIPVEVQGGSHLQSAMHQVIIAVGNVLTKSLAVLFPNVYLREAIEQSAPPVTESQVRDEMPKRYLYLAGSLPSLASILLMSVSNVVVECYCTGGVVTLDCV